MIEALFDQATAAVVKARKTSMTATVPIARLRAFEQVWVESLNG